MSLPFSRWAEPLIILSADQAVEDAIGQGVGELHQHRACRSLEPPAAKTWRREPTSIAVASLPLTCTVASPPFSRILQATARSGRPRGDSGGGHKAEHQLPIESLCKLGRHGGGGRVASLHVEKQSSRLTFSRVVEMIDEILRQGDFKSVRPLPRELEDCIPVKIRPLHAT